MRNRAFRPIAAILGIMLLAAAATTVQAGPIQPANVVHVVGRSNSATQLRLASQEDRARVAPTTTATQDGTATTATPATTGQEGRTGVAVQTEEVTEVTAEECVCEDIPVTGGFTKWPFLGLIPAICLSGICTTDNEPECLTPPCKENPTPTPTPPVPEPATLLLFGTGLATLGAVARRRHTRHKAAKQISQMEG